MMASRAALLLLACFLLLSAKVSPIDPHAQSPHQAPRSPSPAPEPSPAHHVVYVDAKECPSLCVVRCSKNPRQNHCHRVCQTCCRRCRCVPPGTAGNREMCGTCYTDMTTHRNASKCP